VARYVQGQVGKPHVWLQVVSGLRGYEPGQTHGCSAAATQLRQGQPLPKCSSPGKEGSPNLWLLMSSGVDLRHPFEPFKVSH